MELSASIVPLISPVVVFLNLERHSISEIKENPNRSETLWDESFHNPSKRISYSSFEKPLTWRIDGCGSKGTQFFAIPIAKNNSETVALRRIDVYIPDQTRHHRVVKNTLKTVEAIYTQSSEVARLPLAGYITEVLTRWSSQIQNFDSLYRAMPYGSRIIVESITPTPSSAKVRFFPMRSVEAQFVSVSTLQTMWPNLQLPPLLDISQLEIVSQLHQTVSLVRLCPHGQKGLWIFKSNISEPKYTYHELKQLLSLTKHPNIMGRPEYLVVQHGQSQPSPQVLGMIVPYYPLGNLGRMIERRRREGSLDFKTKLGWAKQLTAVLAWLMTTPARYYSELKPDNIICTGSSTIALIDMEQFGNWETFSAPEIYNVEDLARLVRSPLVPATPKEKYKAMLLQHVRDSQADAEGLYSNPEKGYFDAWNALPPERQEAAMVYSLGKVLWCIFEGWSHTTNDLSEEYAVACAWEFPEFRESPPEIAAIVRDCTQGSADWSAGTAADRLVRVETKLYPKGRTGRDGEPEASQAETLRFSRAMWERRLEKMERYLEAKVRWERGIPEDGDEALLGFCSRPKLKDVLCRLESIDGDG